MIHRGRDVRVHQNEDLQTIDLRSPHPSRLLEDPGERVERVEKERYFVSEIRGYLLWVCQGVLVSFFTFNVSRYTEVYRCLPHHICDPGVWGSEFGRLRGKKGSLHEEGDFFLSSSYVVFLGFETESDRSDKIVLMVFNPSIECLLPLHKECRYLRPFGS